MSTKTQATSIAMKTLWGTFDQPKMNHRRDFLRENKLNLRELQKNTTQKLTQQKQEQEKKETKHLQRYQKTQEQNVARRSASQCRNAEPKDKDIPLRKPAGGGGMGLRRSYSQQRESRENLDVDNSSCCCSQQQKPLQQKEQPQNLQHQHHYHQQPQHHHHHQQLHVDHDDGVPRSASNASVISKAESCDKEIQTEDIRDEDFLYEALKKCNSSELIKSKSQNPINNRDNNLTRSQTSLKSIQSREHAPYVYHDHYEDSKSQHSQYSARSQCSHKQNGLNEAELADNDVDEDMEQDFQNLKLDSNAAREQEQHSSARSRQTLCSTMSKKNTNGSIHKLGSRDNLRLPRYMEEEKREKEEERIREMNKDPNCPMGHYTLTEQQRLIALQKAQQKMSTLIKELNHMPMTTETLRIRNRKQEIEKELQQLELDIRTYSKPKVYVVEPPIPY